MKIVNPWCRFLVEELRELQEAIIRSMVEQEGNGVAQDLPKHSASAKCQRSLAHTLFIEYRPASWQKTVSRR
jgi:hypothetical protein